MGGEKGCEEKEQTAGAAEIQHPSGEKVPPPQFKD